ncbi:2Fe-2S iron-sulfur cluster binding domain-containing protein [Nitrogeniibacter aestuarii]|uniref:2Fe-2S iron-sulfur cluster binding domain-containing protein n=1 Tax=Nitrogeniibacter aestuarii TaxID=2815343 RepID=UPI001D125440|nr:2Fe-2S iron-sulfur cluster binding domain-containing protein [Nitrogeniibacter aestuarii]
MSSTGAQYRIELVNTKDSFTCRDDVDVLRGMERLNYRGIPVGCRGGGCGVCKVTVLSGDYETKKMSRAYVSEEEEQAGTVLACRLYARSDLKLEVVGGLKKCLDKKMAKSPFLAQATAAAGSAPPLT